MDCMFYNKKDQKIFTHRYCKTSTKDTTLVVAGSLAAPRIFAVLTEDR